MQRRDFFARVCGVLAGLPLIRPRLFTQPLRLRQNYHYDWESVWIHPREVHSMRDGNFADPMTWGVKVNNQLVQGVAPPETSDTAIIAHAVTIDVPLRDDNSYVCTIPPVSLLTLLPSATLSWNPKKIDALGD